MSVERQICAKSPTKHSYAWSDNKPNGRDLVRAPDAPVGRVSHPPLLDRHSYNNSNLSAAGQWEVCSAPLTLRHFATRLSRQSDHHWWASPHGLTSTTIIVIDMSLQQKSQRHNKDYVCCAIFALLAKQLVCPSFLPSCLLVPEALVWSPCSLLWGDLVLLWACLIWLRVEARRYERTPLCANPLLNWVVTCQSLQHLLLILPKKALSLPIAYVKLCLSPCLRDIYLSINQSIDIR